MTAMSISQDTAATDSDRADGEEEDEEEGSSKSSGQLCLIMCAHTQLYILYIVHVFSRNQYVICVYIGSWNVTHVYIVS